MAAIWEEAITAVMHTVAGSDYKPSKEACDNISDTLILSSYDVVSSNTFSCGTASLSVSATALR